MSHEAHWLACPHLVHYTTTANVTLLCLEAYRRLPLGTLLHMLLQKL
jgi:hypothetical protein